MQPSLCYPPFFLTMTTQQAQGDFEGFIMSYSSNISISALHAFNLWVVMRFAPSLWGMASSSKLISCSTKLQQPISALCFEKTAAFRIKAALHDSKSPSPILPFMFSISDKIGWSDSNSFDEVRSGKFEQLDKPSSVSDFTENSLLNISIH